MWSKLHLDVHVDEYTSLNIQMDRHMWTYIHPDISEFLAEIAVLSKDLWNMKQIIK